MSKHTLSRSRVRRALDAVEVLIEHAQEVVADKDGEYRNALDEFRRAYNDLRGELSELDGDPIIAPSPEE